jgi:hypothetical protein
MRAHGFTITRLGGERGIALITTLLVMMLMSALLVGFTTVVMSDQRYRLIDRDRVRSFYAAQSGLEKLNADLSNLFLANVAPTAAQIDSLKDSPPSIPDVKFLTATDSPDAAYGVRVENPPMGCQEEPPGSKTCNTTISTGPYAGLIALKKVYRLDATARTLDGGETHLMRKVETVAIPVFQFGMFSDVDLSFHAGPNFNFGGRVHSNGNLFLAQNSGNTLTLSQKVTAVKDIIRKELANGSLITASGHTGTVSMAKAAGSYRPLTDSEGSLTGGLGSSKNTNWPNISLTDYNGYIRNGETGARPLNLPVITSGGSNIDIVRRPPPNEDQAAPTGNPVLLAERFYSQVSLRILLSDKKTDITKLPGVTSGDPVSLEDWNAAPPSGYTINGTHPPVAKSPGRLLAPNGNPPTIAAAVAAPAAGGTTSIGVANFPALFRMDAAPQGYLLKVVKSSTTYTVTCSGKTITTFTGCVTSPTPGSAVTGATITAHQPDNTTVSVLSHASTSWASPWTTITVASDTSAFTKPNLFPVTVKKGLNTYRALCSTKTRTTFSGCVYDPTAPNPVTGNITTPATVEFSDGAQTVSLTLGATWTYSTTATTTITTAASATATNTMPATRNWFWVLNGSGSSVLVSCEGFQLRIDLPHQLTGCGFNTALEANAQVSSGALVNAGVGTIGGFLKIELQDTNKEWHDVTLEILNRGIGAANLNTLGKACPDPTPDAILRIQRLRENAETAAGNCSYAASISPTDWVPNVLFDTREALFRAADPGHDNPLLRGVMHYIALDVRNLARYFKGDFGGLGATAKTDNGYSVYFSDRRNNRDASGNETGEFGFEDIINPNDANGVPNGGTDPDNSAEDPNRNDDLETYGQFPSYDGFAQSVPPGQRDFTNPANALNANGSLILTAVRYPYALVNRPLLFRRGLKLINGGLDLADGLKTLKGLTIATENPVYVQGNWNASVTNPMNETHAATSIIADAVTILSNGWNDYRSFTSPYDSSGTNRPRSTNSYYRFAVIAGKNDAFKRPTVGTNHQDFGTDGGAHNFLRMLEGNGGTVHYRGSIATFYFSRQALGVYKNAASGSQPVYDAPTRNFYFDEDFLDPSKLPPLTPVFRDINALGFAQEVRPGK